MHSIMAPKNLMMLFILFFSYAHSRAQTDTTDVASDIEQPAFEGGEASLRDYFEENYPIKARREGIEGHITVSFVVETDGQISEARVLEAHYYRAVIAPFSKRVKHVPIFEDFDADIYRIMNKRVLAVVNKMPKWKAGTKEGVPHKMNCTLPIVYKLNATTAPVQVIQFPTSFIR